MGPTENELPGILKKPW